MLRDSITDRSWAYVSFVFASRHREYSGHISAILGIHIEETDS